MPKLTKRLVEAIEPEAKDLIIRDSELKGFIIKVTPKGKRVYMLYYRTKEGRERKPVIGVHGIIKCEQARDKAQHWLTIVNQGGDPSLDKQTERKNIILSELATRYLEQHAEPKKKPKSVRSDKISLRLYILPAIGKISVSALTVKDVTDLHHALRTKPITANRCIALLSKMLNLAEKWGIRADAGALCRHIEKYEEKKRDRFLGIEEITRLGQVLAEEEIAGRETPNILAAIRMLILTGCRLSEILTLRWEHVDFGNHCLRLPDSKTGAKVVYLAPAALEVLSTIERRDNNPHVIIGKKDGACLVNLQKPWGRLRKKAALENVRLHDLRHSFASMGAASGLSLPIIGALLGHTQASTTQRYAHLVGDPLKQAAGVIGGKISAAMTGKKAEVIALQKRK